MKRFVSLLKAVMSQDMNMFKYRAKSESSKLILPVFLGLIVMLAIGSYYYYIAQALHKINLTYIMLTTSLLVPVVLTFIEGIYKSQSIIFEGKDNNLLLSLPISKQMILISKIIKLYVFQIVYNMLFELPAFVIYIYFETPGISFYLLSLLMIFLLPIIPTIISVFIGYIIKRVSVKFKAKKFIQLVLTFVIFFGIYMLSMKSEDLLNYVVKHATSINEIISKIYFPIGAYVILINKFELLTFIELLIINIIPSVVFIYIISITYFKVISKSQENSTITLNKKYIYKRKSIIKALTIKELKKYFSSTVFVFNTLFGLVLLVAATIGISTNFMGTMQTVLSGAITPEEVNGLMNYLPVVVYGAIILFGFMTSITSSLISIEGKTFNISKSLPVSTRDLLLSKVLMSLVITVPVMFVCDSIFLLLNKVSIFYAVSIFTVSIFVPILSAIIGLLINLKYPKMNAQSDTEVVKQSMSSSVSVFLGMGIAIMFILGLFVNKLSFINIKINTIILIELFIMLLLIIILFNILIKYGTKRYKEIEV